MKKEILTFLEKDKVKFNSIMSKSSDENVVSIRYKVYAHLKNKKYRVVDISEFFGVTEMGVYKGLNKEKLRIEKATKMLILKRHTNGYE